MFREPLFSSQVKYTFLKNAMSIVLVHNINFRAFRAKEQHFACRKIGVRTISYRTDSREVFLLPTMDKEKDTIETAGIFRVIDANINRLREALRVLEEYFRFVCDNANAASALKTARHRLEDMVESVGTQKMLDARDTITDPFAVTVMAEEATRTNLAALLAANFKRGQESARVLEEYGKIPGLDDVVASAKSIRFALYELEKKTAPH